MNLEDVDDRRRALEVECRACGVAAGEECVRGDGRPLERAPAHTRRISDAGVLHAPLDSREIRTPGRASTHPAATHQRPRGPRS